MKHFWLTATVAASLIYVSSSPSFSAEKVVLVTAAEAAQPAQPSGGELARRGITRGPTITEVTPVPAGTMLTSPVHLQFKFEARGGAKINPAEIKVTYLKTPAIDLTDRVKPYTKDSGIDIGEAELPAGTHAFRLDVKDSEGRITTSLFTLNVK